MENALVWLHVTGNIVWIGSILAVAAIVTAPAGDPKLRGELALRVYLRLAAPAFVVSFVCGAARLGMNTSYYLVEHHWMHGKLAAALAVIGLHHVIGGRAKKLARGAVQGSGPTAMLSAVLAVLAALAAFFAIFRIPS
ncbi:MAG: CopD family protein [Polyangiaceae bacterium]|nr:CopD family protein [Polyangiaceae bacterium]